MIFRYLRHILGAVMLTLGLEACRVEPPFAPAIENNKIAIPSGFPEVIFPDDNAFSNERWLLGKKLFYDPILSVDSSISCNTCHKQEFAFADNVAFSPGVFERPGTRNAPSLANVAYQPYYTREGGVPTLEMQVLVPIQEHNEFDFNILEIQKRLRKIADYADMSQAAYGRELDYFVITRALACFERSLISGNSRFDYYKYQGKKAAITAKEKAGYELFKSEKTQCASCHSGFNFTNNSFENNGLYQQYVDLGRKRLTGKDEDLALFKVPSLRNVALTAPYMHDGSLNTLEQVVEHYNKGGNKHKNQSVLVKPLGLSQKEQAQLVAFLEALTDENFITNSDFKP